MSGRRVRSAAGCRVRGACCRLARAMAQPKPPLPRRRGAGPRLWRVSSAASIVTAFREATKRGRGEKRSQGNDAARRALRRRLGVRNDDKKAADWYWLAAGRGDREAMFALAMFRMTGRGGPHDRDEAAKLLAAAAKLGHVVAAYDLALLYLEGQLFPQDFERAAELLRIAAEAGNPASAICAGDVLQGGPRRAEGPTRSRAPARRRRARRQHRCRGRVRHRAVQRHRRRQERDAPRPSYLTKAARQGQSDRTEPARAACTPPAAASRPIRCRRHAGT